MKFFSLTPEQKKKKAADNWKKITRGFMFQDNWSVFWAGAVFGGALVAVFWGFETLWK